MAHLVFQNGVGTVVMYEETLAMLNSEESRVPLLQIKPIANQKPSIGTVSALEWASCQLTLPGASLPFASDFIIGKDLGAGRDG